MDTLNKILTLLGNRNQKELTDYLGLRNTAFSDWKSGKSESYKKYLPQIADFLNVSVDDLLDKNEKSNNEKLAFALFGTSDVDEEVLDDVRKYAEIARRIREEKKEGH